MRLCFFFLLLFSPYALCGQTAMDSTVWVKLIVKDKTDGSFIENAQVISYETMHIYATDSAGSFRNVFNATDSLKVFGLGYEAVVVKVNKFDDLEDGLTLELARRTYMIRSVDVPAKQELHLHLPSDIKLAKKKDEDKPLALRSDVFSSKPPAIAAVFNPVGFLHYYTSKKEKRKRNAIKELAKDAEQQKINEFYNRDIIKEVSGYEEGKKLNDFIVFCNVNLQLTSGDNALLVKERILKLKEKFEDKAQQQTIE